MEMPVSQRNSQVGEDYPVVIKLSQPNNPVSVASGGVKSLAALSLDTFSVVETVAIGMGVIQGNVEQLKNENLRLLAENGALGQQLIASCARESEISRVHRVQEEVLKDQIASLQAQLARQATEQEAQNVRFEGLQAIAEREKTEAVAAAQAVWEQQKSEISQQKKIYKIKSLLFRWKGIT